MSQGRDEVSGFRNQRGRIRDQKGGIRNQRGGIRDQKGGIRDQRGEIRDQRGGIRDQKGRWYLGSAARDQGSQAIRDRDEGPKFVTLLESRVRNLGTKIESAMRNHNSLQP